MSDWTFAAISVLVLIGGLLALWAVDSSRIIRSLRQKVEDLQMVLNEERVSTTEQMTKASDIIRKYQDLLSAVRIFRNVTRDHT